MKNEIKKIIVEYANSPNDIYDYVFVDKLIQLFNKHIEDKESRIYTQINEYCDCDTTSNLITQDIINILKIKEN